jgi:hypothetical protein
MVGTMYSTSILLEISHIYPETTTVVVMGLRIGLYCELFVVMENFGILYLNPSYKRKGGIALE